ncbi:MAG: 2-dehydropantoate 2-reductase [Bacteroidales bacterium 45-6]|nr:MAG: 2-dehydropantoate 2-reductase [Bacteroidales bacterium 45-6]
MKLRYGIVGVGGIGGFYGGKLAFHGEDVHFLLHNDYRYVKEHGLRIDSAAGDFILPRVNAYPHQDQMPVCDVVIVGLKTTNNHLLKDILPPLIHQDTVVLLIQNGLGLEADLAKEFPGLSIAGGLAFICSSKVGPGRISHQDYGALNVGSYSCSKPEIVQNIVSDFVQAGVEACLVDLQSARWKKLVWNIPYNGMTVVLNGKTDELTLHPATRSLLRQMMEEVVAASRAIGVRENLGDEVPGQMLEMTEKMAPYAPSMKLDYDARRPLEIEYIYSRPLEEARKAGVEMPCVAALERQLKFLAEKNR